MKKQAQLIFTHFGEEKQRLKAKEERLELEIALNKLALYDVREEQGIIQDYLREELITDCNEEFADNVLMRMQLENLEFDEAFDEMKINYSKSRILHCYGIDNFYFSKEEVRKWVDRKIDRTMGKYGITAEEKIKVEKFKVGDIVKIVKSSWGNESLVGLKIKIELIEQSSVIFMLEEKPVCICIDDIKKLNGVE